MSYVTQSRNPNPAALLGALGVPAAVGAILVVGLAVTVIPNEDDGFVAITPTVEPPPPEPTVEPKPETPTSAPPVYVPPQPDILSKKPDVITTTTTLPPMSDEPILVNIPNANPVEVRPTGTPTPLIDAIAATPSNNPARWVRNSDYKSRWVREGLSGIARFSLEVSASGRVTDCSITRSTGHGVLDAATCRLVMDRAKFDPARDSTGAPVAGVYSSAVNWQLPE